MAVKRRPRSNTRRSAQIRSASSLKQTLRGIESTLAQVNDDLGRVKSLAEDADLRSRIALGKVRSEPVARDYAVQAESPAALPYAVVDRLNAVGAMAAETAHVSGYLYSKLRALCDAVGAEWGAELEPPAPYERLNLKL